MEFRLPELGEDAGSLAKVTFWYVSAGDAIEKDQPIVEMMTDKATFDVESPVRGRIAEILVKEDETAAVGDVLCAIEPAES